MEPFGAVRDDYRDGTIAAQFYNANKAENAEALSWHQFFPNAEHHVPEIVIDDAAENDEIVAKIFQSWASGFGKKKGA